jgi:manganese transport system ATP-binding protein
MRTVLVHGSPDEVLQPDNLARAFGLDVLRRGETV